MKQAIACFCGAAVCAIIVAFAGAGAAQGEENNAPGQAGDVYTVQVMALKDNKAAHDAAEALTAKGYDAYVVTIADDTTGLPHKVRCGRFATKQEAQLCAANYEMRESAASYVVREAGAPLGAPARPAVAVAGLPVQQGAAAGQSRGFFESPMPDAPFGNLLGGRTYLEVRPAFSYRLRYEDNIDSSTSNKVSDWSNGYIPEIEIEAIGPRFSLNSKAKLDIVEYINERDFNYVDQDYGMTLGYVPNERLELSTNIGYTINHNTNRYFEEGAIGDPVDEEFDRYKEESKILGAGFSYSLTPRSTIGLNGFLTQYTIDDASNDNNFFGATAVYGYTYSPQTTLSLNAGFFEYDFEDAGDDNYYYSGYEYTLRNYSLTGGFDHVVDESFRFGAQAGMRYSKNDSKYSTGDILDPTDRDSGDGNGWVASFDIEKSVNDFDFRLEGFHDITVSSRGSNYENTRLIETNTYHFTRRLSAALQLQFRRARSDGDEFIDTDRDQYTYYIGSSLNYDLYRWLKIRLLHAYRYSESKDNSDSSVNSNTVYLQLRFTPLRPMVIR